MSFTFIQSSLTLKVFIDKDLVREFQRSKGCKKKQLMSTSPRASATTSSSLIDQKIIVIWFNPKVPRLMLAHTIAHESLHVVRRIQTYMGFSKWEPVPEELEAHMLTHTYKEICNQLIGLGVNVTEPSSLKRPEEYDNDDSNLDYEQVVNTLLRTAPHPFAIEQVYTTSNFKLDTKEENATAVISCLPPGVDITDTKNRTPLYRIRVNAEVAAQFIEDLQTSKIFIKPESSKEPI